MLIFIMFFLYKYFDDYIKKNVLLFYDSMCICVVLYFTIVGDCLWCVELSAEL